MRQKIKQPGLVMKGFKFNHARYRGYTMTYF